MTQQLLRDLRIFPVSLQQFFVARLAVFLCIVLTLGIFFRFVNIEHKVFWYDETRTAIRAIAAYPPSAVQNIFDNRITDVQDLQDYQQVHAERGILTSLTVMAQDDPKHAPLYYLAVGLWARLLGDSVGVIRTLSAITSLLCFPCFFWLCWELFRSPLISWVGVSLFAVSPYHILYAQEARQYALWTLTILLSSAALLRAIRVKKIQSWIGYALTVGFGIYAHTLFGLVVITHAIYVALNTSRGIISGKFSRLLTFSKNKLLKIGIPYLLATFVGLSSFLPWAKFILQKRQGLRVEHLEQQVDFLFILKHCFFGLSSIFWDPSGSALIDISNGTETPLFYLIRLPVLALIGYSIYYLYRKAPNRAGLFVFTLMGVGTLTFLLPDLIFGGQRSTILRYMIPGYLGIQLSVAYLLATRGFAACFSDQRAWRLISALVISAGVLSSTISSQAESWWNKSNSYYNPQVAQIVNQASDSILISHYSWHNSTQLLSLSYLLAPKVKLQLLSTPDASQIAGGSSKNHQVFVYNPDDLFRHALIEAGYQLDAAYEPGHLWRLEKRSL